MTREMKEATKRLRAEAEELERKRRGEVELTSMSGAKPPVAEEEEEETSYGPMDLQSRTWQHIVSKYKEAYPNEEVNDGTLVFGSKEKAREFFEEDAKNNTPFTVCAYKDGKPTEEVMVSVGDGKLYRGTHSEVHQQLSQLLKANPPLDAQSQENCKTSMKQLEKLGEELGKPITSNPEDTTEVVHNLPRP